MFPNIRLPPGAFAGQFKQHLKGTGDILQTYIWQRSQSVEKQMKWSVAKYTFAPGVCPWGFGLVVPSALNLARFSQTSCRLYLRCCWPEKHANMKHLASKSSPKRVPKHANLDLGEARRCGSLACFASGVSPASGLGRSPPTAPLECFNV